MIGNFSVRIMEQRHETMDCPGGFEMFCCFDLSMCICMCGMHTHSTLVEFRRQLLGLGSFLPTCGMCRLSSSSQTRIGPLCQPYGCFWQRTRAGVIVILSLADFCLLFLGVLCGPVKLISCPIHLDSMLSHLCAPNAGLLRHPPRLPCSSNPFLPPLQCVL